MGPQWLVTIVSEFGLQCASKLREGVGQPEAAIRSPIEWLLEATGRHLGSEVIAHDEARVDGGEARPDFAIRVDGVVTGHVEIKRPGTNLDPDRFAGHNRRQWERLRDLPNLLYTSGSRWRLYRHGELVAAADFAGDLHTAGASLEMPDLGTEVLLRQFLRWTPPPITSATQLVTAVAPLCRLLREAVREQLAEERRAEDHGAELEDRPFTVLAQSWRDLLFPSATDEVFADGYAQCVTFGLLTARTEGIDVAALPPEETARRLGEHSVHSLMGQALKLLSEHAVSSFQVTMDLLRRVVGAVDWEEIWADRDDAYLHLYESFLEAYDPQLRKASGSYYTPVEVVRAMVRLTHEVLASRLGVSEGFDSSAVTTVDPAMGTGTFLHSIIEHTARQAAQEHGPGSVGASLSELASRLIGFELQMGPYAVADLRAVDLLKSHGAALPPDGLRLHVTNTLDDPHIETRTVPGMTALSKSHRQANRIKSQTPVTVVIGNPPYRERAEGMGGWVESGSATEPGTPLDRFRLPDNGRLEYVLKNLYIYFWAWATWKVFDAHPKDTHGVVCLITTSGYLKGPGFKGMRRYLRRTCSEGWIIDLSPEGMRPDVPTRVFPGVQHPLAIGIFVRRTDTDPDTPADIRYTHVSGLRAQKFTQLTELSLNSEVWLPVHAGWEAPFLPATTSAWSDFPALGDLFCWTAPGIKPNRTWVYAPHPDILHRRWNTLIAENDYQRKRELFKETRDRTLTSQPTGLPGFEMYSRPPIQETGETPPPKRIAYRSFDRQWIVPDSRILDFPRSDLWHADLLVHQLYLSEQHAQPIGSGPAVVASCLIPDMDHFKGSAGGRVLPLFHPDGSANFAPGLLSALSHALEESVTPWDLVAYIAGVTAHPAFTERFTEELVTPGIRVPLTARADLWHQGIALGRELVWAATYGEAFASTGAGRPQGNIAFPSGDLRRPMNLTPIGDEMPDLLDYEHRDGGSGILYLGQGSFAPVTPRMWSYDVGGRNVIKGWFSSRKASPGGRKSSPLDDIHVDSWPREWISELNELLTVLRRVTELEPDQAHLLEQILNGPLITTERLTAGGVRFPASRRDRKPSYTLVTTEPDVDSGRLL